MENPKISVGILNSEEIQFELFGYYFFEQANKIVKGKFKAKKVDEKIIVEGINEKFEINDNARFIPQNEELDSFLIKDVIIGVKFHWERKEDQQFLGELKIIKENNKLTAVNIISIEHYLISVISSEMSATSSEHLLKAHAIISRSWLLAQIEKSKKIKQNKENYSTIKSSIDEYIKWYDREDHLLYDVCADDHCQRYQGITRAYTETVKQAVNFTRGLVLKYEDEICDARFYKSCGGHTENFENVWEPKHHPYLVGIPDYKFTIDDYDLDLTKEKNAEIWIRTTPPAFCAKPSEKILLQVLNDYDLITKDFYRWKVEYEQEELKEIIKQKTGVDFGYIYDLLPVERGVSGRIIKLKIVGEKQTLTIGKELEIRKTLSKSHLYSSAFVVDKIESSERIPKKFILTGAGWGHGVGLCQIGAAVMADMGYKFDEILAHYFKNSNIEKIY
jgi:SpoIID/LytB domain protein